jgi:hypothetical protein
MGQYFIVVNEDKREWIHPHRFGDGMKFWEFCGSSYGLLAGLAVLLRKSSEGGGGDWAGYSAPPGAFSRHPVVGSWAGDRVSIVGDYDKGTLYADAMDSYRDVSFDVIKALATDHYARERVKENLRWRLRGGLEAVGGSDQEDLALYKAIFREKTFQEEREGEQG